MSPLVASTSWRDRYVLAFAAAGTLLVSAGLAAPAWLWLFGTLGVMALSD